MDLINVPGNVRHEDSFAVKQIIRRPGHPGPLEIKTVTLFKRDDMDKSGGRNAGKSVSRTVWRS
jgi:hypothetical protein